LGRPIDLFQPPSTHAKKTAERKAVVGSLDLGNLTTSPVERAFLTVRQELRRFHKTLETTPAVAAGVEFERWSLEQAVEMTAEYLRRKEGAKFEDAFAKLE
jgi:hypothetical protein